MNIHARDKEVARKVGRSGFGSSRKTGLGAVSCAFAPAQLQIKKNMVTYNTYTTQARDLKVLLCLCHIEIESCVLSTLSADKTTCHHRVRAKCYHALCRPFYLH